jgi:hypothetical protein
VDRPGPAADQIEMTENARSALSSAVGLAGERPVDASVVLLAALLYAHRTRLAGMTSALLRSLSNRQPDSCDSEDLLERLGRAIGIAVSDEQASPRVVASRMAVAPLAVLLTFAAQVAKRVSGGSRVSVRHLVVAAILAAEPPLRPQALRELRISAGELRELLLEVALKEPRGGPVDAWRELISPPLASPSRPVGRGRSVFVSYSQKDKHHRERLQISLAHLRRENLVTIWHDGKILPGQEWDQEIARNLENAEVILLLVSPDFLDSSYCYRHEMLQALERHRSGSAIVVPILVRPCDWEHSPLASLQALPSGKRPVSLWPNKDQAWLNVVQGLRKLVSG